MKRNIFTGNSLTAVGIFDRQHIGDSLKALGIPSAPIAILIPVVDDPVEANAGDWTPMVTGTTTWTISATNLQMSINANLGVVKFTRPDTDCNLIHETR